MKRITTLSLLCILVLAAFPGASFAAYTILHEFSGSTSGGRLPEGALVSDGSVLYGTTVIGGDHNSGVVFKINTNGSGFELLHQFQGGAEDGNRPYDSLIREGSVLYGMTAGGGGSFLGVVFKINTDGSGFELLHEFAGAPGDGYYPVGSLTLSGSTLYGMASAGGDHDLGVIFRVNTDGTGFELLHEFAGGAGDGSTPTGSLLFADAALYGMTWGGGASDLGVIFKINPDGTGFLLLHEFTGGADDGATPPDSLLSDGSTLYGMAFYGGDSDRGVIFKIKTDGSDFDLLHEFAGGPDDGGFPRGSLLMSGSTLYGMTEGGGGAGNGVIFRINTDGAGYELLHRFTGAPEDGIWPYSSLLMDGLTLYGTTRNGGINDAGVIFSLDLFDSSMQPIPTLGEWGVIILAVLLAIAAVALMKRRANYTSPGSRC